MQPHYESKGLHCERRRKREIAVRILTNGESWHEACERHVAVMAGKLVRALHATYGGIDTNDEIDGIRPELDKSGAINTKNWKTHARSNK